MGTELESVKEYFTDALQESDKRYIQSGIGILTKLDFSKFYEFTDTVPYSLINSAELSIESVESSNYPPPSVLSLRVLNESTNRMKRFSITNAQDVADLKAYDRLIAVDVGLQSQAAIVDNDSVIYARDRSAFDLTYSSKENKYSMELSLFLQQLAAPLEEKTKYKTFVLHPSVLTGKIPVESGLKNVNRAVFPKDKIKLKIFYTKPTATQ